MSLSLILSGVVLLGMKPLPHERDEPVARRAGRKT
jgi:hypothetical protein